MTTTETTYVAKDEVAVNGPEDELDWSSIDWRTEENNVRRLRQRIFAACVPRAQERNLDVSRDN